MHVIEIFKVKYLYIRDFPGGTSGKEPACPSSRSKRCVFDPWVGKISWRRARATHSSIFAWRIPCTEEPGGLQSVESQRAGHNCSNSAHTACLSTSLLVISSFLCVYFCPFFYSCVSFSSRFWWWCVCLCVRGQGKGRNENRGDVDSGTCGANISCTVCVFALFFCLWYIYFMPWSL